MRGILSTAALALGVFALGAAVPQHLTAGWGPTKQATRAERPKGGGGGWGSGSARRAGGASNVPAISWDGNDSAALEKASNGGKPIVVLFAKEGTDLATYFSGQDYVDMKDSDAVFIAVPYTSDRTPAPGAKETLVPICKLSSDNPARDYDIRVGEEAVLVLDCFGNFDDVGSKFSKKPTSKELKDTLQRLPSKVESLNKKLDKSLAAANTALSKGDRNAAFKAAVKILESGTVGYGAASEAAKMYNTICDEVRTEVAALKEAEDKKEAQKKLGELAGVFTKKAAPSVASEIAAAKKEVAAVAK